MSELENRLNHILEEHQHESGLHMIGGRHKLLDRLVRFCEEELLQERRDDPRSDQSRIGRTA
jgi:hypothetical protein